MRASIFKKVLGSLFLLLGPINIAAADITINVPFDQLVLQSESEGTSTYAYSPPGESNYNLTISVGGSSSISASGIIENSLGGGGGIVIAAGYNPEVLPHPTSIEITVNYSATVASNGEVSCTASDIGGCANGIATETSYRTGALLDFLIYGGGSSITLSSISFTMVGVGPSPSPSPSALPDLSISKVSFAQPVGSPVPQDSDGNPIIATVTPPNAMPAPSASPTQVEASVTVNLNGTSSGATSTDVQLTLNGQVLADKQIDISQFQQGDNTVLIDFTPPTDPTLLGVQSLQATVNASQGIQESNSANNSFSIDVNTMVLCKVSDSGRTVPFASQATAPWAAQNFGLVTVPKAPHTFQKYGCSVTDFYMIMSSYGITNTPLGSPADPFGVGPATSGLEGESLNPGTLNSALANYKTNLLTSGSVALDANNDPLWPGAVDVARAGYQAQCKLTGSCDPTNASNVISFKNYYTNTYDEKGAISAIQNEVCSGNPVMMKFSKPVKGQHFMLATGITWDDNNKEQTLLLNNPATARGQNLLYSGLTKDYPSIIGYVLFHPSADPSMMLITAPMGVHLVVTDPLGRRSGFDPTTNSSYSEIPGASYGEQSIDTPSDPGYTPSTLVDERYFISSSDVLDGAYQVQVFSVTGGSYYLDYRSYDASGTTNDAHYQTGTLKEGASEAVILQHSSISAPIVNGKLNLLSYALIKAGANNLKNSSFEIVGQLAPLTKSPLTLKSDFQLSIGGVTGYQLNVPASSFKAVTILKTTTYVYEGRDVTILIGSSGSVDILLVNADLSKVDTNLLGYVGVGIDSIYGDENSAFKCEGILCSLGGL